MRKVERRAPVRKPNGKVEGGAIVTDGGGRGVRVRGVGRSSMSGDWTIGQESDWPLVMYLTLPAENDLEAFLRGEGV